MASKDIRVLVVDDSALIRKMICDSIDKTPGLEVAAKANSGDRALEILEQVQPDVITLDIQMPGTDGLGTLDGILKLRPTPVIMVSSLTQAGATVTLDALEQGALDYVAKPQNGSQAEEVFGGELMRKIKTAAGANVQRILDIRKERKLRRELPKPVVPTPEDDTTAAPNLADKCVALGISTGGPPALALLFESLQPPFPPMVIVQHMPPQFTQSLAWRLDSLSKLTVKEASTGDILRPNRVLVAPGGKHLSLRRQGSMTKVLVRDGEPVSSHKPSVDVMMKSAAEIYGSRCLGVIMTGMGRDGADGCGHIRSQGGYVLGQDEASSDVYGMNRVAQVEGNVDRQFSLDLAAATITQQVRRLWSPTAEAAAR